MDLKNLFKKKTHIDNLTITNGRVLIEKTENRTIYKVLKMAKNVNYLGSPKTINKGDLIICEEYMYNSSFKIGEKTYYIIRPKQILGTFN